MSLTEEQLLDLKREIEESKARISELKGQKTALLNQLKEDWKCNDIEAAKFKLKKLEQKVTEIDSEIDKLTAELEELYGS